MAEKSIKKNYAYNAGYSVLMVLTPLVTAPYISRVLHASGVGISSYALSVVNYFLLFANLGTWTFARREISYFRDDLVKRSQIFWDVWFLRLISTLLSLAAYIVVVMLCVKSYRTVFLMYAIYLVNSIFDVTWLFSGVEDFVKIFYRNVAVKVADIAYVFIFIKTEEDLPLYVFGFTFFTLLSSAFMWLHLPSYIVRPDFSSLCPQRYLKGSLALFVPTIAIQVYTVLDKSMLGWFTEGGFENGYYEQSMKISKIVLALITALAGVMIPRIGYLFGKDDREQISFYMYRSYNFVWFMGTALCFGLIGISDNFVPWFFGEGYDKVAGLLKISSFLILAIGINNATGVQYLIPTKRQHLFTHSVVIGAVINFLMNIVLIRMYKSYGAVFASVLAETVIALVQFYMVRAEISFTRVMKSGLNYFISGGVMLAVLMLMNRTLTPSAVHTFTMVFTGAAVYFASLFALRDKFLLEYSGRPMDFIRRKFLRRG